MIPAKEDHCVWMVLSILELQDAGDLAIARRELKANRPIGRIGCTHSGHINERRKCILKRQRENR